MPRPNKGPRLVPRKQEGYRRTVFAIRWYERGNKRERSTGTSDLAEAEKKLEQFLAQRYSRPEGPCNPDEILIADVLAMYGEEHAPHTADPARIGDCITALLDFWTDRPVSAVKGETCRAYDKHRAKKEIAQGTRRRELGCLRAAGNYCMREGYVTSFPPVWLPPRPPAKERWLERDEAAALLRAARAEPKARFHLPLFIMTGLYTGARRNAILNLRWTQNTKGGWVDPERGRIDFNSVGRPQTKKKRPIIPIPKRLLRFLCYARARSTCDYVIPYEGNPVGNLR